MGRLAVLIDHKKCTGCRICVQICSTVHEGGISEEGSRIAVTNFDPGFDIAQTCCQCSDPPCVPVCPTEAITYEDSGAPVLINPELCTACGNCIEECPIEAIWYNPTGDYAIKCDLCQGYADKPQCIAMCPSGCLEYGEYRSEPRQTIKEVGNSIRKNLFGISVMNAQEDI